jgi:hypothetical protein
VLDQERRTASILALMSVLEMEPRKHQEMEMEMEPE